MATIPRLGDDRAVTRPVRDPGITLSRPGGVVSPGIEATGREGQRVIAAGQRLISQQTELFLKEKARINRIELMELNLRLQGLGSDLLLELKQIKGRDAVRSDLHAKFGAKFDDEVETIAESIEDADVRERFDLMAMERRQVLTFAADTHHVQESDRWGREVFQLHGEKHLEAIVKEDDPAEIEELIETHEDVIAAFGQDNGWSNDRIDFEKKEFRSKSYVAVMERLDAAGRSIEAREYWKAHKGDLTKDDFARTAGWVKASSMKIVAQEFADEIVIQIAKTKEAQRRAATIANPMDERRALSLAREKFEGDQEKQVIAELKSRFAEAGVFEVRAKRENVERIINKILKGSATPVRAGLPGFEGVDVISWKEWRALDTDTRQFILKREALIRMQETDPAAARTERLSIEANLALLRSVNNEKFANLNSVEATMGLRESDARYWIKAISKDKGAGVDADFKKIIIENAFADLDIIGPGTKNKERRAMFAALVESGLRRAELGDKPPVGPVEFEAIVKKLSRITATGGRDSPLALRPFDKRSEALIDGDFILGVEITDKDREAYTEWLRVNHLGTPPMDELMRRMAGADHANEHGLWPAIVAKFKAEQ